MKRIFFPGCGFGFWFLLPKLFEVSDDHYIFGASGGSLMCMIALMEKRKQTYETIMQIAKEVQSEIAFPPNMYDVNKRFIEKIARHIDREKLHQNLRRLRVQITQINPLKRVIVKPKNVEELMEAILISTYVPFLSINDSQEFFYRKNGVAYVDGGVYNLIHGSDAWSIENRYGSIPFYIPTERKCLEMYREGAVYFSKN